MNEAKDEIKNIVNLAYQIINDIYIENPNLPREKILEKIKTKLRDTRFLMIWAGTILFLICKVPVSCMVSIKRWKGKISSIFKKALKNRLFKLPLSGLKNEDAFALTWNWKNPKMKIFVLR